MKLLILRSIILAGFISLTIFTAQGKPSGRIEIQGVKDSTVFVSKFDSLNNRCFQCHGQQKYEYTNPTLGTKVKANMCSERIVHRNDFYSSNHMPAS
jgi:hypothetical protein